MPVELTRNGTRGVNVTRLPRPLMKVGLAAFSVVARLRGARLLTLTTYGSRSQREHSVPLQYFDDPATLAPGWSSPRSAAGPSTRPGM